MSEVKIMTADVLAQHTRVAVRAECWRCRAPLIEGMAYLGGGLSMMCAACAVQRGRQRVDDAETLVQAEKVELNTLKAALKAIAAARLAETPGPAPERRATDAAD
jgi:hypothetical protein